MLIASLVTRGAIVAVFGGDEDEVSTLIEEFYAEIEANPEFDALNALSEENVQYCVWPGITARPQWCPE